MPLPLKGKPLGFKPDDRVGQERQRGVAEIRGLIQQLQQNGTLNRVPRRVIDQDAEATNQDRAIIYQQVTKAVTLQLYKAVPGDEIAVICSDQTVGLTNKITILPYPGSVINTAEEYILDGSTGFSVSLLAVDSDVEGRVDWVSF